MAGVLDNPDAAYAKLREMGKGLFGPNGGLNGILGGLSGLAGGGQTSGTGGAGGTDNGQGNLLGGQLGQTLGNLIQQGLGAAQPGGEQTSPGRRRSIPPNSTPQTQATPAPQSPDGSSAQAQGHQDGQQDSQPMNDVLRQLFNR
jgi:AsmA protein